MLGVDPAQNLARAAEATDIPMLAEFCGLDIARRVVREHGEANAVMARNVLRHVPDPNDVVAGIAHCLNEDGIGAIEFHWIGKIMGELHHEIYHEHFFCHSLHSINELLKRHQLVLFDVTESPICGGSLIAYFAKTPHLATAALQEKPTLEGEHGLATLNTWQQFARRSLEHRLKLKDMVETEVRAGSKVIGYGTSARSSTLLNFCGIDSQHLRCIADRSPLKHDRYTLGTNIPVVPPERALAENPDTILLLAWNFWDKIMASLADAGFHGIVTVSLPNDPQLLKV